MTQRTQKYRTYRKQAQLTRLYSEQIHTLPFHHTREKDPIVLPFDLLCEGKDKKHCIPFYHTRVKEHVQQI